VRVMKPIHIEAEEIVSAINALYLHYPELREDEELRADTFEGETDLHAILDRIALRILDQDTQAEALDASIKALNSRKAMFARREESLRELARKLMELADLRKVVLPTATLSRRVAGDKVHVTSMEEIPDEYLRKRVEPDLARIKEALKNGTSVPGACLTNSGETIAIRY
jgi:hypothetical protein